MKKIVNVMVITIISSLLICSCTFTQKESDSYLGAVSGYVEIVNDTLDSIINEVGQLEYFIDKDFIVFDIRAYKDSSLYTFYVSVDSFEVTCLRHKKEFEEYFKMVAFEQRSGTVDTFSYFKEAERIIRPLDARVSEKQFSEALSLCNIGYQKVINGEYTLFQSVN